MKLKHQATKAIVGFAIAALALVQFSCKKDTQEATKTYTIEGLWIGTYSVNSLPAQGALFASFSIFPDGTVLTKTEASDGKFYYSNGNWSLSGSNIFTATVTTFVTPYGGSPVTQQITGTFSKTGTLSDVTWIDTNNPNGTPHAGKYLSMQRVN